MDAQLAAFDYITTGENTGGLPTQDWLPEEIKWGCTLASTPEL